jgi:hypothetical protein
VVDGDPILLTLLQDANLQIALQAACVLLTHDPRTPGVEEVMARGLTAGVLFRGQALKALEQCDPKLAGLRVLLEHLWEMTEDNEVRLELTRLLNRVKEAEQATEPLAKQSQP